MCSCPPVLDSPSCGYRSSARVCFADVPRLTGSFPTASGRCEPIRAVLVCHSRDSLRSCWPPALARVGFRPKPSADPSPALCLMNPVSPLCLRLARTLALSLQSGSSAAWCGLSFFLVAGRDAHARRSCCQGTLVPQREAGWRSVVPGTAPCPAPEPLHREPSAQDGQCGRELAVPPPGQPGSGKAPAGEAPAGWCPRGQD